LWFIAIRSDLASSNLFYYLQVVGTVPCYLVFPGVVVERFIDQVGTDDVLLVPFYRAIKQKMQQEDPTRVNTSYMHCCSISRQLV